MGYIRARVTEESAEGWRIFCREHGVTVSALVEAFGPLLGEWAGTDMSPRGVELVRRARAIDAARRQRG